MKRAKYQAAHVSPGGQAGKRCRHNSCCFCRPQRGGQEVAAEAMIIHPTAAAADVERMELTWTDEQELRGEGRCCLLPTDQHVAEDTPCMLGVAGRANCVMRASRGSLGLVMLMQAFSRNSTTKRPAEFRRVRYYLLVLVWYIAWLLYSVAQMFIVRKCIPHVGKYLPSEKRG